MSLGYKFILDEEAFRFAITRTGAERQQLRGVFHALADDPYQEGQLDEIDEDGRRVELVLRGKFLITFWADHAVKELRITRIDVVKPRQRFV